MYAKRIIPCLDVKNGRVVKGVSFVDLVDAGDPVECAKAYDKQGADELVLLDITATHEGRSTMLDVVKRVAETVFIPFTVGGGIKTVDDFKELLRAGADKISVNSAAVRNPDLINEAAYKFGSQCVVCAIAAGISPNQAMIICAVKFDGREVAFITVTRTPSITDSAKKILCTASSLFGINIKIDVIMNENKITISRMKSAPSAIIILLSKLNSYRNIFFS